MLSISEANTEIARQGKHQAMGAFLPDLAKIYELEYEGDLAYSTEGQLLGHLVMGVELLEFQHHLD